jgi:hypothetical protein
MRTVFQKLNPALWRDLERRLGTHDLVEWLETEAERVATLGRNGRSPVAFTAALLRDRNVISHRSKPYLPALQTILATPQGYEIHYSPFQRIEDQRFGIAHEIAHTFWLTTDGSGRPVSPLQRVIGDDPTIEWLCNRGAAAILLPRSDLAKVVDNVPFVLHQIPSIAAHYIVPERLVARRILHELAKTGGDADILAVRLKDKQARVWWFSPAPGKPEVNKRVENRVIPQGCLPDVPSGKTTEVELDGRWWLLGSSASSPSRAKPLNQCDPMKAKQAWVGRIENTWYIVLPVLV